MRFRSADLLLPPPPRCWVVLIYLYYNVVGLYTGIIKLTVVGIAFPTRQYFIGWDTGLSHGSFGGTKRMCFRSVVNMCFNLDRSLEHKVYNIMILLYYRY